jgi:hypothetical protein
LTRFFIDDAIYFSVGLGATSRGASDMATGLVGRKMARKHGGPGGETPDKGGAEPPARRNVVSIRGTEAWRDWLMGLAAHRRLKAADVIDQALIEYAQKYGYEKKAPPR